MIMDNSLHLLVPWFLHLWSGEEEGHLLSLLLRDAVTIQSLLPVAKASYEDQ